MQVERGGETQARGMSGGTTEEEHWERGLMKEAQAGEEHRGQKQSKDRRTIQTTHTMRLK